MGRSRRVGHQWLWWSIAGVSLTIGVVSLAVASMPTRDPKVLILSSPPVTTTSRARVLSHVVSFPSIPKSRPIQLTIPAINVSTYVGTLGLQADHQIAVPTSSHVVGWYIDGPTPGQVGSAVILGHVDSYRGPGTFFYLKELTAGDAITAVLADGTVTHFVVTRVVQYSKTAFPDRLVYGSHGIRSLQLVTCGGTFDHATGSYESNVVVFSRLVGVSLHKS
ncbi:MAG: class F sortase [Acidimicrobiales bacterium]